MDWTTLGTVRAATTVRTTIAAPMMGPAVAEGSRTAGRATTRATAEAMTTATLGTAAHPMGIAIWVRRWAATAGTTGPHPTEAAGTRITAWAPPVVTPVASGTGA